MSTQLRSPSSTALSLPSLTPNSKPSSKHAAHKQAVILYREEHKSQHGDADTYIADLERRLAAVTAEHGVLLAYATKHSDEQWQQQQAQIDALLQYKIKYIQLLSAERATRLLCSTKQQQQNEIVQQVQQQLQAAHTKEVESHKQYHLLKQQYEDLQFQLSTLQATYKHHQQSSNELHATHQQLLTAHQQHAATISALQLQHAAQQHETENALKELKLHRQENETLQASVQRHEVAAMNERHNVHDLKQQIQRYITREGLLKTSVIEVEQLPVLRASVTELEIENRLLQQNTAQLRLENQVLLDKQKQHIQQSVARIVATSNASQHTQDGNSVSHSVVEELQSRLTQSLIDLSQAQQLATQNNHTIQQQQQQLQEIKPQLLQKEEKISTLQQQRQELSDSMQELNQKFTSARYKQTVMEDEFDMVQQRLSKAVAAKQKLQSELDAGSEQLSRLTAECSALDQQLAEQKQESDASIKAEQVKRSVAEQETADVRAEQETLQTQFTNLQTRYMTQQTELHSSQQKVGQLTTQIQLLEQTVQRLKVVERDGVANEMELKGRTGEVGKLTDQIQSLQQKETKQAAVIESLEMSVNTTKQQLLVQQAQGVKLQGQLRQVTADLEQSAREKTALTLQLKELRETTVMQRTNSQKKLSYAVG